MGFELGKVLDQDRKEQHNSVESVRIQGAWCPLSPGRGAGQVQLSSLSHTMSSNPILASIRPEHLHIPQSKVLPCSIGVPRKNNYLEVLGRCESWW